jgi:hypothetical protein
LFSGIKGRHGLAGVNIENIVFLDTIFLDFLLFEKEKTRGL